MRRRFHEGHSRAFSALAEAYADDLYTLCLRICAVEAEAEELAQEALVKALKACRRYDPGRPFRPWLLSIGVNLCRDRLRSAWWQRIIPLRRRQVPSEISAEELLHELERDRKVRRSLATLPAIYREAIALHHLQDMTYAEMSEITGTKVPALKQRVRRGRRMLRDSMTRMYPELVGDRIKDTESASSERGS